MATSTFREEIFESYGDSCSLYGGEMLLKQQKKTPLRAPFSGETAPVFFTVKSDAE